MRITGIKTAVIEANFDWTLVRVETDEGVSGLGEAFFAPGLTAMMREFESVLVGEDPFDIDRLYQKMRWASSAGSIAGFAYNAISGIEAALWDLKGRALGVPIWQLLGGKFRDRVRIYADCHAGHTLESLGPLLQRRAPAWLGNGDAAGSRSGYFESLPDESDDFTPKAYAEKARAVADRGFTALKFDLDVPVSGSVAPDAYARNLNPAQLDHLASLVAETCAAVGPHVEVAFDCHWRFTVKDAIRLARAIEGVPVAWLEDPTPPENPTALAKVTHATSTPIGTGENWFAREGFREALSLGALDIVLPDLQKCGGLGEGKRIAELADMHDLSVAPHNISGPIGTMASVHVAAAIPNFHSLEWHAQDVPFFDALLVGAGPLIVNGHVEVPTGPGLGVDLDLDAAARYAKAGEPFFA
ncbi:MAG TPA: mandelate racemase/muconate lactonizing enzyme family protein [Acidimicrobiales bacterium]|nr:mandelate racemase/muconate lactonizing enzyme family protein [Acidimicrobiales bacterium]